MHAYELHYPVDAECLCCRVVARFTFKSSSDQVICASCVRHQGSTAGKLTQRDRDHVNLWRSELALAAESQQQQEASLRATIAAHDEELRRLRLQLAEAQHAIETELLDGPLASLQGWWESVRIAHANDARDRSYRSRDHALRALWRLNRLHHDGNQANRCSCGRTTGLCSEWKVLEGDREFLYRWEAKQIERLKADLDHGLPEDHPDVLRTGRHRYGYRAG